MTPPTSTTRVVWIVIAGAIGVAFGIWYLTPDILEVDVVDARGQSEVSIVLTEEGFKPERLRISAGTKVIFTTTRSDPFWPASNPHPAHNLYNAFDPQNPVAPDTSWTFVPSEAGVWGYHDHIRSYYNGILYVEGGASTGGPLETH